MGPVNLTDDDLQRLYAWVDEISLSRPKRNIARDFSDGVLVAEVVAFYFPKLVELHNYAAANSLDQKMYNWNTLNDKVFKKMQYQVSKSDLEAVAHCSPGAIEKVLYALQLKMARHRARLKVGLGAAAPPRGERQQDTDNTQRGEVAGNRSTGERRPSHRGHGSPGEMEGSPSPSVRSIPGVGPGAGAEMGAGGKVGKAGLQQKRVGRRLSLEEEEALLEEKDQEIADLRETNEILRLKISKLEHLIRLKDSKIHKLQGAASRPEQHHQPP